jgi:Flp pilus assembly protein TadG
MIVGVNASREGCLKQDKGSAVIEFVVLALPLLLPLMMYVTVLHENSTLTSDLHNLARQSARAFVTSSDESVESQRLQALLRIFESKVLVPHGTSEVPALHVECSNSPCLTPNGRVRVTASVHLTDSRFGGFLRFLNSSNSLVSASDTQIVDAWR